MHLWKRLHLIKDFVWGGNSGRNESSKEKRGCCRIWHSPERNASVTSKRKMHCLLRYWTKREMQNKYPAWHLNCSCPWGGLQKLWYIGMDGWMWSSVPQTASTACNTTEGVGFGLLRGHCCPGVLSFLRCEEGLNGVPAFSHRHCICLHELLMFPVAFLVYCTPVPGFGTVFLWQCSKSMMHF